MGGRWTALFSLIAVVGVLWVFIGGEGIEGPESGLTGLDLEIPADEEPASEDLQAAQGASGEIETGPEAPEQENGPTAESAREAIDATVGELELRVTDKAGTLLGPEGVSARLLYVRRPDRPAIPGEVGENGAVFRFGKLPVGAVRVHVEGDLVLAGTALVTIQAGITAQRTIAVGRAGAVQYDIQFADGSRPGDVSLSLVAEGGKPVRAWYRPHRQGTERVRPQRGRTVRVPPEGVIYGLGAGTYTLKAVATGGASGNFKGAETLGVSLGGTGYVTVLLER